jgi:hypothetical protein
MEDRRMRGHGSVVAACLVLTLAGAPAANAAIAAKEPAAPGLSAMPGTEDPAPAPSFPGAAPAPGAAMAPAPGSAAPEREPVWGVLVRGGYFGLPDTIANRLYRQHPKVDGHTYGGELRYHGDGGGRVTSIDRVQLPRSARIGSREERPAWRQRQHLHVSSP